MVGGLRAVDESIGVSMIGQALLYAAVGLAHFLLEAQFLKVIPPWVPWPVKVNRLAAVTEILLAAALLLPASRLWALRGIVLGLLLVLPVHLHMLADKKASLGWPRWVLWLRLPMQGLLILWAYSSVP